MAGGSLSLTRSAGDSAEPISQHERPAVCIYAAPEELEHLTETLSKIGYRALAHSYAAHNRPPPLAERYAAAVVVDSVDNPLEFAAEMSFQCPVLLISSQGSTLDVSELVEWLNDLVGPHRETPLSILIVDDDEILAETYALALENSGMRAHVETNPSAGLSRITETYPDLVLMDLQMPGVSGVELARVIRQSRRHLSLPLVFLSSERDPSRQLEARKLGGDDFIVKPVDLEWLVSLVRMRADRAIRLRSMMDRDSLTGLLNHGKFVDRLFHELERCQRTGVELSLVLIDLDSFKSVNDTYGHVSGDQVLRTLAHTLSVALRRIDIVGRYGGEEFAILLLDTPPQAAVVVIDKIRRRFSEIEFEAKNHKFFVTFSAGVSGSRKHLTTEALISAADDYMYQAKAEGRNRVLGSKS